MSAVKVLQKAKKDVVFVIAGLILSTVFIGCESQQQASGTPISESKAESTLSDKKLPKDYPFENGSLKISLYGKGKSDQSFMVERRENENSTFDLIDPGYGDIYARWETNNGEVSKGDAYGWFKVDRDNFAKNGLKISAEKPGRLTLEIAAIGTDKINPALCVAYCIIDRVEQKTPVELTAYIKDGKREFRIQGGDTGGGQYVLISKDGNWGSRDIPIDEFNQLINTDSTLDEWQGVTTKAVVRGNEIYQDAYSEELDMYEVMSKLLAGISYSEP